MPRVIPQLRVGLRESAVDRLRRLVPVNGRFLSQGQRRLEIVPGDAASIHAVSLELEDALRQLERIENRLEHGVQ